jgi:hypothetical protein
LFPEVKNHRLQDVSNPAVFSQFAKLGVHGIVSKNEEMSEVLAATEQSIRPTRSVPLAQHSGANAGASLQRLSPND